MKMLVVYAKDLKEGFAEYALSIAKIMIPHLKFFFHEMVRAAAAEILPYLLECVKSNGWIYYLSVCFLFERGMWCVKRESLVFEGWTHRTKIKNVFCPSTLMRYLLSHFNRWFRIYLNGVRHSQVSVIGEDPFPWLLFGLTVTWKIMVTGSLSLAGYSYLA